MISIYVPSVHNFVLVFVQIERSVPFIPMEHFVLMILLDLIVQILIFVPMVQLDATNFK